MGESVRKDNFFCGFDNFCAPNLPKNSIWTNFSNVLALFFAFFVLNTEFLDTPPPPHALQIWNAQDLYFDKKKWVNRYVRIKNCGFDNFCAPNLPKNSIWTNFSTIFRVFRP
jgi:hypothetical protein